jgi:hypothetical protein
VDVGSGEQRLRGGVAGEERADGLRASHRQRILTHRGAAAGQRPSDGI